MNSLHKELTAYIDGELSADKAREMEIALSQDVELRRLEQRLRKSIEVVENSAPVAVPLNLRRSVLEAVAEPSWRERFFRFPHLAPTALGLAAAAAVTLMVVQPGTVDDAVPADEEKLFLAQNFELVENLDLVDFDSAEDLEVVATLNELETPR